MWTKNQGILSIVLHYEIAAHTKKQFRSLLWLTMGSTNCTFVSAAAVYLASKKSLQLAMQILAAFKKWEFFDPFISVATTMSMWCLKSWIFAWTHKGQNRKLELSSCKMAKIMDGETIANAPKTRHFTTILRGTEEIPLAPMLKMSQILCIEYFAVCSTCSNGQFSK